MNQTLQYSIVIDWSHEDQANVVVLPEWADQYAMPVAHGSTYEDVAEVTCVTAYDARWRTE